MTLRHSFALILTTSLTAFASAEPIVIEGVLPAALDQPRIFLAISKNATSDPLVTKGESMESMLADLLGDEGDAKESSEAFQIEAFLDTGASGVMLSKITADALGLAPATAKDGTALKYFDIGVAGEEEFGVSDPLFLRMCDYGNVETGDKLERYSKPMGPTRIKIRAEGGMLDELIGGIDIVGMPAMRENVVVLDARLLTGLETRALEDMGRIETKLLAPNDPSIPKSEVQIKLTLVNFDRFTRHIPEDFETANTFDNPMVGPNPFDPSDQSAPIVLTHGDKSTHTTMLLDTGAASSMISESTARELGITIDESGALTNIPAAEQFSLPIGGIGGMKTVPGFYVDAMVLPAIKGESIRYVKVPMLVLDISVHDQKTGEDYTLGGVLGMNLFVGSASIDMMSSLGPDEMRGGAFDFIVIDHMQKQLGLVLHKTSP